MATISLERTIKLSKQDGELLAASKPTAKYHEALAQGKRRKEERMLKSTEIKLPWLNIITQK